MDSRPLVIDLCCGSGGWAAGFIAEGYQVIGYDVCEQPLYPGELRVCDIRGLDGLKFLDAAVIVASPPCDEFSRFQMPWTRARNPTQPDLSIVEACYRIAKEAGVPIILENVSIAQRWLGTAAWHCGSYYLWGDVPALMPRIIHRPKENMSSTWKLQRARIPLDLATWIARCFKPANFVDTDSIRLADATDARIATAKE